MAESPARADAVTPPPDLPIRQIAYFVSDVRAAARAHHRSYGSGPYFVAEHIPLRRVLYRGASARLDHSSAYGQWGPLMIEFVQQNDPGESAFHDLYPAESGRGGLHHVAVFVDDLPAAVERYRRAGFDTASYAEMNDGFCFAMIDQVRESGHMLELYEPWPVLTEFYRRVADAAGNFDGKNVIRPIVFG